MPNVLLPAEPSIGIRGEGGYVRLIDKIPGIKRPGWPWPPSKDFLISCRLDSYYVAVVTNGGPGLQNKVNILIPKRNRLHN